MEGMGYTMSRLIRNRVVKGGMGSNLSTYGLKNKSKYKHKYNGKVYLLESKDSLGRYVRFEVYNLSKWCKRKGISYTSLCNTFDRESYYKGYRILVRDLHIVDGRVL